LDLEIGHDGFDRVEGSFELFRGFGRLPVSAIVDNFDFGLSTALCAVRE